MHKIQFSLLKNLPERGLPHEMDLAFDEMYCLMIGPFFKLCRRSSNFFA
jgi:hypothetical protein